MSVAPRSGPLLDELSLKTTREVGRCHRCQTWVGPGLVGWWDGEGPLYDTCVAIYSSELAEVLELYLRDRCTLAALGVRITARLVSFLVTHGELPEHEARVGPERPSPGGVGAGGTWVGGEGPPGGES